MKRQGRRERLLSAEGKQGAESPWLATAAEATRTTARPVLVESRMVCGSQTACPHCPREARTRLWVWLKAVLPSREGVAWRRQPFPGLCGNASNILSCPNLAGAGRVLLASVGTGPLAKHPAARRVSKVSVVARVRNPALRE